MLIDVISVEGVGDEVIVSIFTVVLVLVIIGFLFLRKQNLVRMIHPEEEANVNSVRETMAEAHGAAPRRRYNTENQCPVCLNELHFAVETNCGHVFCGQCMVAYWNHGTWIGAARCPVCRQNVTILFQCFTENELNTAEVEEADQRNSLLREINGYNRRYSGEPRPFMDYVRDLPTTLRHLWNAFFSVGGLVYMFRIRILLCLLAGFAYLISPLDIIPEAVFGILGLLDDIFVFLLLAIYVSIIYRRYLANSNE